MAIYTTNIKSEDSIDAILSIADSFGLKRINKNYLANNNSISKITCSDEVTKKNYIPYTNKAINWHTDGYYNDVKNQIKAVILHCVKTAETGGENKLLDPEILYIMLRDKNPDYIKALMSDNAILIPARLDKNNNIAREEIKGAIFSIDENNKLYMRFTIRKKNIAFKDSSLINEALGYLNNILNSKSDYIFKLELEPGMGLICNNVLHTRSAFIDSYDNTRLYYRARYLDRIANT